MIKVIAIEDDHENMDFLLRMLRDHLPEVKVIGQGRTNSDLIKLIEHDKLEPDVLLLDINLPDGHVFHTLDILDTSEICLIFITAFDEYAIRAFDKAALHYLLKPFSKEQLLQAFQRVHKQKKESANTGLQLEIARLSMQQTPNTMQKTSIASVDGLRFVYMKDILRLEGDDSYTTFVMLNGERILASRNLGYFTDFYEQHNFVKIHQTHMVNLNHLKRYIKGADAKVELDNGDIVPVARRCKSNLRVRLRSIYGSE